MTSKTEYMVYVYGIGRSITQGTKYQWPDDVQRTALGTRYYAKNYDAGLRQPNYTAFWSYRQCQLEWPRCRTADEFKPGWNRVATACFFKRLCREYSLIEVAGAHQ